MILNVSQIPVSDAAVFLGVSADTVRRLLASGRLDHGSTSSARTTVDGKSLADYARNERIAPSDRAAVGRSARNRFVGIVTKITTDTVMAQVELQCGPFRVVSLVSSESVRELELEVGSVATAVIKATNVLIETTERE